LAAIPEEPLSEYRIAVLLAMRGTHKDQAEGELLRGLLPLVPQLVGEIVGEPVLGTPEALDLIQRGNNAVFLAQSNYDGADAAEFLETVRSDVRRAILR
jgi:DNA-directed RNA polymerase specialized sigma subunit